MPVIPLREFGRKPNKARVKSQTEQEAEQKLDQALGRLQAALPLGWAGADANNNNNNQSSWFVADASVQQQASKAILGLAEALAQHYKAVERDASWTKMVQAAVISVGPPLRFLLRLTNPAIAQRAAHACHVAASHLDTWRDALLPLLAAPLVALLDSKDPITVHHVCSALVLLILDKPGNRSKTKVKGFQPIRTFTAQLLFESFVEAEALERMKRQLASQGSLEIPGHKAGSSQGRQVASNILGLLLLAVKKSEKLHEAAVGDLEWVAVLGRSMASPDGSVVAAATNVAAALAAGESRFGAALLRAQLLISPILQRQLALPGSSEDGGCAPALRLLAALGPLPNSDTLLDCQRLSKFVVRIILTTPSTNDSLLLETLTTIRALLRRRSGAWALALLSSGLAQGLVRLLGWPAPSDRSGEVKAGDHRNPPGQNEEIDPQTRKMCWRVVELLGFSGGLGAKGSGHGKPTAIAGVFGDLPKLVWSHFHSKVYFFSPGDAGSAAERVEVSRALLGFLTSPFSALSKATRAIAMQDYGSMSEMRIGILPGDPPGYFHGARTADADSVLEGGLLKAAALAALDPLRISAATGFRIVTLLALKLDSVLGHVSDEERFTEAEFDGPFLDAVGDQFPLSPAKTSPDETPFVSSVETHQRETAEFGSLRGDGDSPILGSETAEARDGTSEAAQNRDSGTQRAGNISTGNPGEDVSKQCSDDVGKGSDDVMKSHDDVSESLEQWEGKDGSLLAALQAFCGMYGRWRSSLEPSPSESVRQQLDGGAKGAENGSYRCGETFGANGGTTRTGVGTTRAESGTTNAASGITRAEGESARQLGGRDWWRAYSTSLPITEALCGNLCGGLRRQLERVCGGDAFSWGARCLAARGLSQMGVYGCPSKLGGEVGAVFESGSDGLRCDADGREGGSDRSEVVFHFSDGQTVRAHRAILAARCPALLAMPSESTSGRAHRPKLTAVEAAQSEPLDMPRSTLSNGSETPADARTSGGVQLSHRVSYRAFRALLEFVYKGWVDLGGPGKREAERELLLLARRCQLDSLTALLEGGRPLPGDRPPQYSLANALRTPIGMAQCDVTLIIGDVSLRAHRVVLAARSEYFRALFRSGMRDSVSGVIDLPDTSASAVAAALHYLYTGQLVRPQNPSSSSSKAACARGKSTANQWLSANQGSLLNQEATANPGFAANQSLPNQGLPANPKVTATQGHPQTGPSNDLTPHAAAAPSPSVKQDPLSNFGDWSLVVYVDTAALAGRWMLDRLPGLCLEQVSRHLTPEYATAVLHAAAACAQWAFCEAAVSKLAPRFRALLDDEGFRGLPEELQEAVRVEHVRLQQEG